MTAKPLLMLSRDPGGTRQMVGLHHALTGNPPELSGDGGLARLRERLGEWDGIRVVAKDFAIPVWQAAGIPVESWDGTLPDPEAAAALLTATGDVDDDTPQQSWRRAREAGCPSHAFIDCGINVARRFHDAGGALSRPDFVYVPDAACLADLTGIVALEQVELIPDLVVWIARRELAAATAGAARLRESWRRGRDRPVLLFVSENVAELAALGRPSAYGELDNLERLRACLRGEVEIAGIERRDWLLVIRPHPKEAAGKFAAYEGDALVSREGSSAEAILAADLVVGMRSTLLREAADAGRPVISLVSP